MRRVYVLIVLLASTTAVRADVAPPPGKKSLPVTRTIECDEKTLASYQFFTTRWDPGYDTDARGRPIPTAPYEKKSDRKPHYILGRVIFKPGVPQSVRGSLYAVPVEKVPKNPGEEFAEALAKGKVPGAFSYPYGDVRTTVPISDPRKEIIITDVIERIDPERGIIVKRTTNDPRPADTRDEEGTDPQSDSTSEDWMKSPTTWVAASAAVAGLVLGGLWLGWRIRR